MHLKLIISFVYFQKDFIFHRRLVGLLNHPKECQANTDSHFGAKSWLFPILGTEWLITTHTYPGMCGKRFIRDFFCFHKCLFYCHVSSGTHSQHSKGQRKAHAVQQEAGNILSFLLGDYMQRWFGLNPKTWVTRKIKRVTNILHCHSLVT